MNGSFIGSPQRLLGSLKFRLASAGVLAPVMRAEAGTLAARQQLEIRYADDRKAWPTPCLGATS